MKDKRRSLRVAIISLNWLGDAVMAMPAVQRLKRMRPEWHLSMVTKPPLAALWGMHDGVDTALAAANNREAIQHLRDGNFDRVVVMPRSFRSAWWAYRSGIAERVGASGRMRNRLLTHCPELTPKDGLPHQAHEMLRLFGLEALEGEILTPRITPPAEAMTKAAELLPDDGTWVGLIPGAARGPSKRWPAEHFLQLAKTLNEQENLRIALFGTEADQEVCQPIADATEGAVNVAGRTSMAEFAACLERCQGIVANDSGGMHLAVAVGTPVVGLFGLTNPIRTGPLGDHATVLQHAPGGSRKIPRKSEAASAALAAINPDEVEVALLALLNRGKAPR